VDNRYSRQRLFKPIGEQGQHLLEQSTVTIIGCGALGSAIAESLVRAGVGQLHLVDRDIVEISNLQRQQLFSERHAEEMIPKVEAARTRLLEIRSDARITVYLDHADGMLMEQLAAKSDLIMDATDNFETRLLINDAARKHNRPWIYGACVGSSGVVFPFTPDSHVCLRCLLPVLPSLNETCDTVGIIGPAVQYTAALQNAEALKWLTGNRAAMMNKVCHFDLWQHSHMDIGLSRMHQPDCPTCGESPVYPELMSAAQTQVAVLCGRNTVQIIPDRKRTITLADAEKAGQAVGAGVRRTPYFVELQMSDEHRVMIFENGRLLIHGISNIHQGRKLYHQLFG
jgi:molybdopterin/thiamine biosynthesis adenylyltransferase